MQWYIRYTCILSCRTRHSHSSSYTYTPTLRRHWTPETCEFKSPSLFLFVSAVQLYCVLLCNCTRMVGGWVVGGWMVLLLYSCAAVELSCCYSRPPPPARPVDRVVDRAVDHAPPPSPGCRGPSSSIARRRPIARFAHRRPLARSPARRRPLARSPAVVRSFARRRLLTVVLVNPAFISHAYQVPGTRAPVRGQSGFLV